MGMRTPLSRARGNGAAKSGVGHWVTARATAIALVPLVIFFLATMVAMVGASYEEAQAYFSHPLISIGYSLLIIIGLWHMKLGLAEVVADYIQSEGMKMFLLVLINSFAFVAGAACLLSILRLYVTG